jgi:hypothetical protein
MTKLVLEVWPIPQFAGVGKTYFAVGEPRLIRKGQRDFVCFEVPVTGAPSAARLFDRCHQPIEVAPVQHVNGLAVVAVDRDVASVELS